MEDQDHRVIARRMDLFHQQEEGPGMIFWHPRGFVIYQLIEEEIRKRMRTAGFKEVRTPQLLDRALWEASGTGRNSPRQCSSSKTANNRKR